MFSPFEYSQSDPQFSVKIDAEGIHFDISVDDWKKYILTFLQEEKYIMRNEYYLVPDGYYSHILFPDKHCLLRLCQNWYSYLGTLSDEEREEISILLHDENVDSHLLYHVVGELDIRIAVHCYETESFKEDEYMQLVEELGCESNYIRIPVGTVFRMKSSRSSPAILMRTSRALTVLKERELAFVAQRRNMKIPADGYVDSFDCGGCQTIVMFPGRTCISAGSFTVTVYPVTQGKVYFCHRSKPMGKAFEIISYRPLPHRISREQMREAQIPVCRDTLPLLGYKEWKPWNIASIVFSK